MPLMLGAMLASILEMWPTHIPSQPDLDPVRIDTFVCTAGFFTPSHLDAMTSMSETRTHISACENDLLAMQHDIMPSFKEVIRRLSPGPRIPAVVHSLRFEGQISCLKKYFGWHLHNVAQVTEKMLRDAVLDRAHVESGCLTPNEAGKGGKTRDGKA